jgi:hypothetical protein
VSQTRVLTVGAYERDNFGDLLFLLLTERYLTGCEIVAAAPFAADMTPLLDRRVVAYGDALNNSEFDVIWSVGGQIGGTTLESALRMSKSPAEYAAFRAAAPAEKRDLMRAALHGADLASPYIPTPGAFGRNAAAVSVLNSVGIAGARGLAPHVREEVFEVLRTTDVVSVRDRESSDFLSRIGVAHTLAPTWSTRSACSSRTTRTRPRTSLSCSSPPGCWGGSGTSGSLASWSGARTSAASGSGS